MKSTIYLYRRDKTNVCNFANKFFEFYKKSEYKLKLYDKFRVEFQDRFEGVETMPFEYRDMKKVGSNVLLIFDKKLTEEELCLWEIFKIGILIGVSDANE
jgi:hypothetical protein